MFAKKFLAGSIVSLSLIFILQNVACAGIIKVDIANPYGESVLELSENGDTIFIQDIPDYYLYTYNVDQLNGMEVEDEQDVDEIHQAVVTAANAASAYYEGIDPGSGVYNNLDVATRICENHFNSLKNLLICLNSVKK